MTPFNKCRNKKERTYKDCISLKIAGLETEAGRDISEAHDLNRGRPREARMRPQPQGAPVLEADLPEAAVSLGESHLEAICTDPGTTRRFLIRHPRGVEDELVIDGCQMAESGPGDS